MRRRAIADAAIERAQRTAEATETVIREEQIKLARATYSLLWPIIRGYQRRVAEDPHGELHVSPQEIRVFLSAMKEAREAASFGTQREDLGEAEAL